jgi:hypothetical protein
MPLINHPVVRPGLRLKGLLVCVGLSLFGVNAVRATDALYLNSSVLNYTIPGNPPPIIDATTFDNESVYSVTYSTYSSRTMLPFETKNTVNYLNGENGLMTFNSPPGTNGMIYNLYGIAAEFYTWDPVLNNTFMAGSFTNLGTIRVDSLLDGNNVFDEAGFQFYYLSALGQCIVSATNIVNPGNIVIGAEGLLQMTGQNVDLSRGVFNMESTLNNNQGVIGSILLNGVNFNSTGAVGVDTNGDWNPGMDLAATFAMSSYVPLSPYYLYLTNTTSYFDVRTNGGVVIYRSVFIQNDSPQVPYNVYIDNPNTVNLGFEGGAAHVEWMGLTVDSATGNAQTNYLYLTDNYVYGASTNNFVYGGVPENFNFFTSPTPLLANPITPGFMDVFTDAFMSNSYAYMNGSILASSVSTNVSATNPHGTLTNLPGRVMITASQELNLDQAIIGGPNYLSLTATNQFDGSGGAQIAAPYADLNLGVTNGSMTVSNLLMGSIPNWSGNLQAWSTRWIEVDTVNNVTNDFRVLIVGSQLVPNSVPWVQNLKLHAATNLVISDALNVYNSMAIDSQAITLTTNGVGNGATSPDGELNWIGVGTFGPTQLPNLRCLTNNGAIRAANLAQFTGNANTYSNTITPGTPAVTATGKLSELVGANVKKGTEVAIGTNQYVFVNLLTNKLANQVKIAANFDGSMSNLIAAINRSTGAGTSYSTNTKANPLVAAGPLVTSGSLTNHAFVLTAITNGAAGNSIVTATTSTNLSWNGHGTLFGGINTTPAVTNTTVTPVVVPYEAFINNGLLSDQGTILYAKNFLSSGVISNGVGNFTATNLTTTLTNGAIYAGGNVSITTGSLLASNLTLQCLSLTLTPTNFIDAGLTNGNFWTVGRTNGTGGQGFALTIKPPVGDMLGTTITNICPGPNKSIFNTWAGTNVGVSVLGFSNNMALGRLVLTSPGSGSKIIFNGATGVSNALYVDCLELGGSLTNGLYNSFEFTNWLTINPNITIYYAQALINGVSVAEGINTASTQSGKNRGRLLWVPEYAGYYSSATNVSGGVTNVVNAALLASHNIDSNGNGIANAYDPTPFFDASQVHLTIVMTNVPALSPRLTWNTIPNATNFVYYSTNLAGNWRLYTNFISPTPYLAYPSAAKPMSVVDTNNVGGARFYRVVVYPWLTYPY